MVSLSITHTVCMINLVLHVNLFVFQRRSQWCVISFPHRTTALKYVVKWSCYLIASNLVRIRNKSIQQHIYCWPCFINVVLHIISHVQILNMQQLRIMKNACSVASACSHHNISCLSPFPRRKSADLILRYFFVLTFLFFSIFVLLPFKGIPEI